MAMVIADTACVDPRAEIEDEVEIGPYCVVGPGVKIGRGTRLIGHVYVMPETSLGKENTIWPFAVIGGDPNDQKPAAVGSKLMIGDRNLIREGVTILRGTPRANGVTRLGDRNVLLAHAHVDSDCQIGDDNTLAQGVIVGRQVCIESLAHLSSGVTVHPNVTVGECGFVGGPARIHHDVPRYMLVDGSPARIRCLNIVAVKRKGVDKDGLEALHEAHRLLFRARMGIEHAAEILATHGHLTAEVRNLFDFLHSQQEGRHGRALERPRGVSETTVETPDDRSA